MPTSSSNSCPDSVTQEPVSRRRAAANLLSALGLATLSACASRDEQRDPTDTDTDIDADADGTVSAALTSTTVCWVDTLTNLRALAHPAVGAVDSKIAILETYANPNDGGGGVFYWDADADTEDNGTTIRPNDVTAIQKGRWRRQFSGSIDVRWFGARGNGATNDRGAIQDAINAALVGCGRVYLPAGTYYTDANTITTPTTANAKLRISGAGKALTRITRLSTSATTTLDIQLTGASSVEIEDLTIAGPSGLAPANLSIGINWSTVLGDLTHRLRIARVEVTGKHDTAVENSGGGRVELVDCDLEATDAVVGMFCSSELTDGGGASLYASGGTWKTNGVLTAAGSVGLYIHPHIPYVVQGVTFQTMGRYAIYQNGSWTSPRGPAVATGCRFIDCHMAQTKGNGLSEFVGCVATGTSSKLGTKLDGHVNVSGCMFQRSDSIGYGAGTFSKVTIRNCVFIDTELGTGGAAGNHWVVSSSKITVTDNAPSWLGVQCVNGSTELRDVTFVDETTRAVSDPLQYQTFVRMSLGSPAVQAIDCRFIGGRGKLSSGFYVETGTLTMNGCEFASGGTAEAVWLTAAVAANSLDGEDNRFTNGAYVYVAGTGQQRLIRRRSLNPSSVASAAALAANASAFCHHDTHVVTGSAVIANLTSPASFVGSVRLVAATGSAWSIAATGNLAPKTTSVRAAGSVVELLWEPITGKWLEA